MGSYAFPLFSGTPVLQKEYLIESFIAGEDTIVRHYHYNAFGFLSAIVDSPRYRQYRTTCDATCDSIGRIQQVSLLRTDQPMVISKYSWLADGRVAFFVCDSSGVCSDSGVIEASGRVRFVRLPEIMLPTFIEQRLMIVVSDSTFIMSKNGDFITTYYWQFDDRGTDTSWHYRKPEGKKTWIQSYTNKYFPDGRLMKRFPAMEGAPRCTCIYSDPLSVIAKAQHAKERYLSSAKIEATWFRGYSCLLNGKKMHFPNQKNFNGPLIVSSSHSGRFMLLLQPK
jgi:hypothetical protein